MNEQINEFVICRSLSNASTQLAWLTRSQSTSPHHDHFRLNFSPQELSTKTNE